MSKRDEILSKLDVIPSLPSVVMEIYRQVQNPDVDFGKLSEMINYEPGLAANVLKLANSAYFGFSRQVDDVRIAVARLGTKRIAELVMTIALSPMMEKGVKGYDLPPGKLWEHSVTTAVGAEKLAEVLEVPRPDYTFTAGILHDVGKIVLGNFVEVDVEEIVNYAYEKQVPFNVAERELLGIDHAEAGGLLLRNWGIPEHLVEVVMGHHEPEKYNGDNVVLSLVHIADTISLISGFGIGLDGLFYRPNSDVLKKYRLTSRMVERVASYMVEKLEELKKAMFS